MNLLARELYKNDPAARESFEIIHKAYEILGSKEDLKNKISFVQKVIDDKIKEISFEIVIPFVAPVIVESIVVPYDQIEVTPRDINEVIELNRGLPVGSLSE